MSQKDEFQFSVLREDSAILKLVVTYDGEVKDIVATANINLRALALNSG
jgi:hypothetical protein